MMNNIFGHYNEVAEIEILNTKIEGDYLECDVVEFSYYAVAGVINGEDAIYDGVIEKQTNTMPVIMWIVLGGLGITALSVVLYFRFFKKEEIE